MQFELVTYTIRKLVESKTGAKCFATYPPKDSTAFGSQVGNDYHTFIMFTQVYEFQTSQGIICKIYLFYRNKKTHGYPEFSSCEYGIYTGNRFISLFKEHMEDKTEAQFSQLVADKLIESINNL